MSPTQGPPEHRPRRELFPVLTTPPPAVDPVCGMTVDPAMARASTVYEGQTYYFCCPSCLQTFQADPSRYLRGAHDAHGAGAPPAEQVIDPVCGMTVDPATAAGSWEYHGHTYYFCSPHCLHQFQADPERHLAPAPPAAAASPATPPGTKVEYFCPMDPEVISDRPGSCPKCGMALQPRTLTLEEAPDPELADMSRRFWIGLVLTIPLWVVAMGPMLPGWTTVPHWTGRLGDWANWVQLILATPVVLWCGWPFFARAWTSIVYRSPNMFTLIALGVGTAYSYSVVATLAPGIFPAEFQMPGGMVETYYETAATITILVLLGQVLEIRARGRTNQAIRRLLGLAPKTARIVRPDGREEDVPLESVQPGAILRV